MDEDDDQGLHPDAGPYVEDARGYKPDDSEDDADESFIDKLKEGFVGDDDQIETDDGEE